MTQPYPLYPNIRIHPLNESSPFTNKFILPMLEPVIYELAVSNPSWSFEEHGTTTGNEQTIYAKGFKVIDSRDNHLGNIVAERNYGKRSSGPWVFEIQNRRISMTRERGSAVITGNSKVVLKTVKKYFSPPSIQEKVDVITGTAKNRVYAAMMTANENYEGVNRKITPAIHAFVTANWAQVLDSMKDSDRAIAETLPSLKEAQLSVKEMLNQINSAQHLTVLIDDDTYITHYGGTTRTYGTDDLPTSIKVNVGLLKLTEAGMPVLGVGVRVSDKTFVIYKGDDNGTVI